MTNDVGGEDFRQLTDYSPSPYLNVHHNTSVQRNRITAHIL